MTLKAESPVSGRIIRVVVAIVATAFIATTAQPAFAGTATAKTAVKTQLEPQPRITGVTPLAWIPAKVTLTLECLTTGEKATGAVAKLDPYYYRVTYNGITGYMSDSDVYTAKDATALGLPLCNAASTPALPAEPLSPWGGSVTSSSVVLAWRDTSNNENEFKTQFSIDGGKSWTAGPSAAANSTSLSVGGLAPSQAYIFQVGSSNAAGTKWSGYVNVKTSAAPVTKNVGSGGCDYVKSGGNYVRKAGAGTVLGIYSLAGWTVAVCGPRPNFDGGSVGAAGLGVNPYGGAPGSSDLDGYQCTELTARWLYYVYGTKHANAQGVYDGGNGKDVVTIYARDFPNVFAAYSNARTNPPVAGDVISFNTGTAAGHVGIVYTVNINSSGVGSIQVLEQNSDRPGGKTGVSTYAVSNWNIQQAVNWLHKK